MHFQYFMIKNHLEVLILKPKMEQLHLATASLRSVNDVNNREGLNSIQIFLYQEKALIKKQVCFFHFKMLELFIIWQVSIQPDASSVKMKAAHL